MQGADLECMAIEGIAAAKAMTPAVPRDVAFLELDVLLRLAASLRPPFGARKRRKRGS
jgi:hypothetical protein